MNHKFDISKLIMLNPEILEALESDECRSLGMVECVQFDAVWNSLPKRIRRRISIDDAMAIRDLLRDWVRATYSDAARLALREDHAVLQDVFLHRANLVPSRGAA